MTKDNAAIQDLLLLSPPGQFNAVAGEVDAITKGENVESDVMMAEARTKYGQQTGASILEEQQQQQQQADETQKPPFRAALEKALSAYKTKYYSTKSVAMNYIVTKNEDSATLVIRMYAERLDIANYTSGSWHSEWTIDEESASIGGKIHIHVYCYESGNVQMETTHQFEKKQVDGVAKSFVNQISRWEASVVTKLTDMYEQTMADKLKSLRRVMPYTRTRMDWNVLAHRMVQNLSSSTPATR